MRRTERNRTVIVTWLLLASLPTVADTLYLADQTTDPTQLMATIRRVNPAITNAQLDRQVSEYRDIADGVRAGLAGAATGETALGTYYYGKVIDYQIGPRAGSLTDLLNHDIIVFRPLTREGNRVGDEDLNISAGLVKFAFHAFDTADDFRWKFSNRHLLIGTPFGSDEHRDSIYAIVDPDGSMELSSGQQRNFGSDITEGKITNMIISSGPNSMNFMQTAMWSFKDPTQLAIWDRNVPGMSAIDLLITIAQAGHYPQITPDIKAMATQALSLMCSLVNADPEFALPQLSDAAARASQVGAGCRNSLIYFLNGPEDLAVFEQSDPQYFAILPVSMTDYREATLEFLAADETTRTFTTFLEGDTSGASWQMTPDGPVPNAPHSFGMDLIAEIALGYRDEDLGTRRQELATQTLRSMMAVRWEEDEATRSFYELDRRSYRLSYMNWAAFEHEGEMPSDKLNWITEQFCTIGWGHEDDISYVVSGALNNAWGILANEYFAQSLDNESQQNLMKSAAIVARAYKSAGRDDHEKALLDTIENELNELKVGMAENEETQYVNRRFSEIMDILVRDDSICATL